MALAGVSTDTLESHRRWAERLSIRFPLVSDSDRIAGQELGLMRTLGIGGWSVELFHRATLLADRDGTIAAGWGNLKIRGHARAVLAAARALAGTSRPSA